MAVATRPLTFATANVAVAGTAVLPSAAIPDNCRQVVLLNRGPVDALYGIAAPGAAALTEGTNAARLPNGGSLTLGIGLLRDRGFMDNGNVVGSGLVYDGVGGLPVIDITYVNVMGAS